MVVRLCVYASVCGVRVGPRVESILLINKAYTRGWRGSGVVPTILSTGWAGGVGVSVRGLVVRFL